MAGIPSYELWMAQTAVRGRIRSSALQKLDKAIKEYDTSKAPEKIKLIRRAFAGWQLHNGDWEKSSRNHAPLFLMTALNKALYVDLKLPPEEIQALKFIDDARRRKLVTLFQGKTVRWRVAQDFAILKGAMSDIGKAKQDAGQAASAAVQPAVTEAVNMMFGTELRDIRELAAKVVAETGTAAMVHTIEQICSYLPIISLVADGGKMLTQWGQVIYKAYRQYEVSNHTFVLRDDPAAACAALQTLLMRETANQAAKASITTAAFAANTALHAAKGAGAVFSPMVGAAKSAANATRIIAKFAMEYRETVQLNKLLKDPTKLDLQAFKVCPLLGAYFLICADTSDLFSMFFQEFGQSGWMENFELLKKKHIDPVLTRAADVVQNSPFVIPNVTLHRKANAGMAGSMFTIFSAMTG